MTNSVSLGVAYSDQAIANGSLGGNISGNPVFTGNVTFNGTITNQAAETMTGNLTLNGTANVFNGNITAGNLTIGAGKKLTLTSTTGLVVAANTTNATPGNGTINALAGTFKTGNLTTANATLQSFLVTNSQVLTNDKVLSHVTGGNYTLGKPIVQQTVAGATGGNFTITLLNAGADAGVLNGSVDVSFIVLKAV